MAKRRRPTKFSEETIFSAILWRCYYKKVEKFTGKKAEKIK